MGTKTKCAEHIIYMIDQQKRCMAVDLKIQGGNFPPYPGHNL